MTESARPGASTEKLLDAVVVAMKAAPQEQLQEEWMAPIVKLYKVVHATVNFDDDLVPASKQRYPKFRGDEKAWLCMPFKDSCLLSDRSYIDWVRFATAATKDL